MLFRSIKERAKRSSKNRPRGALEAKSIAVARSIYREALESKVMPAIRSKLPEARKAPIYIQQDNAKPHIPPEDELIAAAGRMGGSDIRLRCQPPNSPDMNVLDLGYFRSMEALQQKDPNSNIDGLIKAAQSAFEDLDARTLNKTFLSFQERMKETMRLNGSNKCKIPHMRKNALESEGKLPLCVPIEASPVRSATSLLETAQVSHTEQRSEPQVKAPERQQSIARQCADYGRQHHQHLCAPERPKSIMHQSYRRAHTPENRQSIVDQCHQHSRASKNRQSIVDQCHQHLCTPENQQSAPHQYHQHLHTPENQQSAPYQYHQHLYTPENQQSAPYQCYKHAHTPEHQQSITNQHLFTQPRATENQQNIVGKLPNHTQQCHQPSHTQPQISERQQSIGNQQMHLQGGPKQHVRRKKNMQEKEPLLEQLQNSCSRKHHCVPAPKKRARSELGVRVELEDPPFRKLKTN